MSLPRSFDFFGPGPVSIIFQTTDDFDGSSLNQTIVPDIKPAMVVFPAQAGGGRVDFHHRPIVVSKAVITPFGSVGQVSLVTPNSLGADIESVIGKFSSTVSKLDLQTLIPPGSYLKITSASPGAKNVLITGRDVTSGALL